VYCCLKRRNSYKSTPNDLASLTLNNHSTSLFSDLNNNNHHHSHHPHHHHHHHHLAHPTNNTSHSDLNTFTSSSFTFSSSTSHANRIGLSSSISSITNQNNMKTPLKEICITIPTAKPSLNESKPQLSIESKIKAKSLFERY
jgi:hypothetical protein